MWRLGDLVRVTETLSKKNIPTSILSMAQAGKCLSSVLAILV